MLFQVFVGAQAACVALSSGVVVNTVGRIDLRTLHTLRGQKTVLWVHCTLLCFATCMDMHGFTLVYIYIYIYICVRCSVVGVA